MKLIFTLIALTITSQTIFAKPFKEGYYYTKDGKKIEGFIKFRRATFSLFGSKPSEIIFKGNKDSSATKFTADDISSFVIGSDSFSIVYNIKINSIQGEYKKDFAKVIVSGRMNLFIHMSSSSDGKSDYDNDRYVLSKDNKNYLGIWNSKKQREEIASLFSADADIKARILNKDFDKDIPGLVKEYNSK
jgi:hypothetical protein